MNPNRTVPPIAVFVPILAIGGLIFVTLKLIFPAKKDTEMKPEAAPAKTETENHQKEAETATFRAIPAEIPVEPTIVPIPSAPKPVVPPLSVPPVPGIASPVFVPAAVPLTKDMAQVSPQPPPKKRKIITPEDVATAFQRGARALTLTAGVTALKNLGFGKTAAYEALSPDGRFASWLQFAPDGIMTWKS